MQQPLCHASVFLTRPGETITGKIPALQHTPSDFHVCSSRSLSNIREEEHLLPLPTLDLSGKLILPHCWPVGFLSLAHSPRSQVSLNNKANIYSTSWYSCLNVDKVLDRSVPYLLHL